MKKILLGISLLTIAAINANAQTITKTVTKKTITKKTTTFTKPAGVVFKNSDDSFSYAIGLNLASDLKHRDIIKINTALVKKGLDDALKGTPPSLTDAQVNQTIQQRLKQAMDNKLNDEKAKGDAFLAANGKRAGVTTLPSGVQYEVLQNADSSGASPSEKDTVVANYAGTLIDGTEFDNSYKRNQPITIPVNGVIRGWTEILQKMTVGDKWKVYIPSNMGYGDRGAGGTIPGGATLIFQIELLGIKRAVTPTVVTPSTVKP
jgi:FKBP-type peptidyl-prolyl cis-trans isomerase FklB